MTVTLITGTSTGIGLATAIHLANAGHKVHAGVRNPDGATKLKNAIEQSDGKISLLEMDVQDEASITNAVAQVLSEDGQIDVLINNAGIARGTSVEETPMSTVRTVFETNFFGAVKLTQLIIPGMRERKSGTIINMSSIAGRYVSPINTFYASSKYALEAFSESLATQLAAFDIRVAIIEPGFIATPIFENTAKSQPTPGPDSPYYMHTKRHMNILAQQIVKFAPTPAEAVAEVIEHAITTDDPKLRYLSGGDAQLLLAARNNLSDEEYVRIVSVKDDEEYYAQSAKWLGLELFG